MNKGILSEIEPLENGLTYDSQMNNKENYSGMKETRDGNYQ